MLDECTNELVLSRSNTQEKHRTNCSFYLKIGACRHGDKCSRLHTRPTSSKTILLKNFYHFGGIIRQDLTKEKEQREFDEFFREVYLEIDGEYGEIEEMTVCNNAGEHMLGNVYVKFFHESNARNAVEALNNRWFDGKPIHCELSPVADFRDACCRQYENGECSRGGFCNFMHLKKISSSLKRKLEKERDKTVRRKKSAKWRKMSECGNKKEDGSLPKKYQDAYSSDESSWSDYGPSSSGNHRSSTPFAFRADRYASDVSESDSETDPEFEAHKQLVRRQRWEELRGKFEMQQKWDEDRELAGVTDTLKEGDEKYEKALNDAADVMSETLNVINTPEFETMEGWKLKSENKIDKIYSKRFAVGKIFTLRTTLDVPCEELFLDHWNNFEQTAYKNKNTSLAEKIAILSPHVEIIHYALKDFGLVKGRDFVTTRIYRRINGDIIEAARSYDTEEVTRHKKKARGKLLLGGGRFRVHPEDAQKTIVDYIICLDMNAPDITKSVIEKLLSKFILEDVERVRQEIEKSKTDNKADE